MQVIFLQSYYSQMKKTEILKIADEIENNYLEENYTDYIDSLAYKNVSSIMLYDLEGNIIYSTNSNLYDMQIPFDKNSKSPTNEQRKGIDFGPSKMVNIDGATIVKKTMQENSKKINSVLKIDRFKSEIFVHSRVLENSSACLVIVASIDPIDSTTTVLQSQLIYITIISLIISAIISIFLSNKLSKPIEEMTKSAEILANGNYNVHFENSGYYEFDKLANTLNYATDKLSKTDKIRKELIANVSHDLKTPLTMIKAYSEKILDISGDNKQKREQDLKIIISETDRLTRLVNDMLDLSKIESSNEALNKERFNICEVASHIVDSFKIGYDLKKCEFSIVAPKNLIVYADKTKIEQVIYNFFSNAINHTGENKKITINIKDISKKVRVEVIDNGEGIDEDKIEYIWNRYYRADKNYSRNDKGSGLGLAIAKNIIEKHNGRYGVESKKGIGSTFYFEIDK